eukprot:3241981-Amphidinium_carterae.1
MTSWSLTTWQRRLEVRLLSNKGRTTQAMHAKKGHNSKGTKLINGDATSPHKYSLLFGGELSRLIAPLTMSSCRPSKVLDHAWASLRLPHEVETKAVHAIKTKPTQMCNSNFCAAKVRM